MKKVINILAGIASIALLVAAWQKWLPLELLETFGFVTGAWTVWLTVKQNIWSWPIGIVSSGVFLFVFFQARLFADSGLQIVYVVLGLLGWYWWLFGGKERSKLSVGNSSLKTNITLAVIAVVATYFFTNYLKSINDAAPFLDALTTVLSLIAQYLLTKKYIESWYIWISVDVIYIYLYATKGLGLTSVLYFVFLSMCIKGIIDWRNSQKSALPSNSNN